MWKRLWLIDRGGGNWRCRCKGRFPQGQDLIQIRIGEVDKKEEEEEGGDGGGDENHRGIDRQDQGQGSRRVEGVYGGVRGGKNVIEEIDEKGVEEEEKNDKGEVEEEDEEEKVVEEGGESEERILYGGLDGGGSVDP